MIVKADLFDGFARSAGVGTALIQVVLSAFSAKTLIPAAVICRKIGLTAEVAEAFRGGPQRKEIRGTSRQSVIS